MHPHSLSISMVKNGGKRSRVSYNIISRDLSWDWHISETASVTTAYCSVELTLINAMLVDRTLPPPVCMCVCVLDVMAHGAITSSMILHPASG